MEFENEEEFQRYIEEQENLVQIICTQQRLEVLLKTKRHLEKKIRPLFHSEEERKIRNVDYTKLFNYIDDLSAIEAKLLSKSVQLKQQHLSQFQEK